MQFATSDTKFFRLRLNIVKYGTFVNRVEECHGSHEFIDLESEAIDIDDVSIVLDDDSLMDITNTLTKEQKEKLLSIYKKSV